MKVSIAEGNCHKDFIVHPRNSHIGKIAGTHTGYKYKPTWRLSTTIVETTEDAKYVQLEEIIFSRKSLTETYVEQVKRFDTWLIQHRIVRNIARRRRYHNRENPVSTPKRKRLDRQEKLAAKVLDILHRDRKFLFKLRVEAKLKKMNGDMLSFTPQDGAQEHFAMGLDHMLSSVSALAGQHLSEPVMMEIEGIIALLLALQGTRDFVSACAVLALYFRKYYDRSLAMQAMEYVQNFITDPQGGLEDPDLEGAEGASTYDWIEMMKNLHGNWSMVKENKLFGHLSKVLGLVVTMEMCKASDVTFSIKEMKLIEPDQKVIHGSAMDIVDAALGSVSFFVEIASLCWKNNSLKPLVVNDAAAIELDEEYANICSYWELVKNGNLKKVRGISDHEFDNRLEALGFKLRALLPNLKSFDKKLVQEKYSRLLNMKNDFTTMKLSSGTRKAPYAIELYGESSQGKSTLGEQALSAMLSSAKLPTGKEYQASYNPADKYMSTWTTDKLVMTIDDIANEKSDFVEKPPTRTIIDLCNNQPYYANMADLNSKGKIFVEPAIVLVTTNVKDLDARAYSNCPYSVQRRMNIVVTVNAKPQFQFKDSRGKAIGIDSAAVAREYDSMEKEPLFDDIWTLTVERAVMPENKATTAQYEPLSYKGEKLIDVSFKRFLNFVIEEFHVHLRSQELIVGRMLRRQKQLHLCGVDGCVQMKEFCEEHPHTDIQHHDGDHQYDETSDDEEEACRAMLSTPESSVCSEEEEDSEFDIEDDETVDDAESTIDPEWEAERERQEIIHCRRYPEDMSGMIPMDPHWGEEVYDALTSTGERIYNRISGDLFGFGEVTEGAAAYLILQQGRKFAKHWDWVQCVPSSWVHNPRFQMLAMAANSGRLRTIYIRRSCIIWTAAISASAYTFRRGPGVFLPMCTMTSAAAAYLQLGMVKSVEKHYLIELEHRNSISDLYKDIRDKHVANMCKAGGIVAVLYGISKVYRIWRKRMRPSEEEVKPSEEKETKEVEPIEVQGALEPKTQQEIDERDKEESPWTQVALRPLPIQKAAANTTVEQLRKIVDKNLTYGTVETDDGNLAVNCLFLRANVAVVPQHYFKQDNIKITFRKEQPEQAAGMFSAKLSKSKSYFIPNTDLALCYVSSGGSFKDLGKYLPAGQLSKLEFDLTYRSKEGCLTKASGLADYCLTGHSETSFEGLSYKSLTMNTRPGLCGAVITSSAKPMILGFHLGGRSGTPQGCAGILTMEQYRNGLAYLRELEGVLLTGTGEQFDERVMGVDIMTNKPLHKKSPLNFQPHRSQIQYFGSCIGHTTFRSSAKPTIITEHVTDVTGAPNIYCGPIEQPQWEPWQKALENMAVPAEQFEWDILDLAIKDYKKPLIPIFKSEFWNKTRPLTDLENWNGVPGKKFLDRVKASTSIGFPLTGKKSEYLVEIEPLGDYTKVVEPVEIIQKEIDRCMDCYKRGERAFPIAKACKKDEVLSKRKCRIFFSNPTAFTFLVRKYFLPILRVLQFHPLLSECCVGVNCHGPEWDELVKHMLKFGIERLFMGDYGNYDQKLVAQILLAALRILIDFAKLVDYDPEDIAVMEAMSGDLVYAIINFNGDLIGLTEGSHISGNSLTVILNGICGSLNMRCYFFSNNKLPEGAEQMNFRDFAALCTYGDDNGGTVSEKLKNFTIKGASKFLAKYGQKFTMPDKESELVDFLPVEEFEFLKRKSVYHPKLGVELGALCDKSCFKMLHYYLRDKRSPNTPEYACALNIDTACREWFNHGEEVYEKRREQLQEIAKRAEISHLCEELNTTYDERVFEWKKRYC
jgi:hypothetical protein